MSKSPMEELNKLTELLQKTLTICEEDREMAKVNYNDLKAQLELAVEMSDHEGMTSAEAGLESNVNKALELVFKSSDKLVKVTDTMTKVLITNLNNQNRLEVANKLALGPGGERLVNSPVNIQDLQKKLMTEKNKED